MSGTPVAAPARPRQVTVAGVQAVVGGVFAVLLLVALAGQLNSQEIRSAAAKAISNSHADRFGLTVDKVLTILRYSISVLAVLSAASVVLGIFVLRRHRGSRVALTVVGGLTAFVLLFAMPLGWMGSAYIGVALVMLWSRPARAWFSPPQDAGPRYPPPAGLPPRPPGSW